MKRMHLRIPALLLALVMSISALSAAAAESPAFRDIAGHWAEEAVTSWAKRGVILGDHGMARPDDPILRAEASAILNRVFGFQRLGSGEFSDVPENAWYRDDVRKLNAAGVLLGYGKGEIRPEANITREESTVMLFRAFGLKPLADAPDVFVDSGAISSWARPCVNTMASLGYLHGYLTPEGGARFDPQSDITRAEFVTVVDNMAAAFYWEASVYADETVKGNAVLRARGARLRNITVERGLYLAEGLGQGDAHLENVRAGRLIVRGGGVHSLYAEEALSFDGMDVTEAALPVTLKFPLAWKQEVTAYFGGVDGIELTESQELCVVTFQKAWSSDQPFQAGGGPDSGGGSADRRMDSLVAGQVTSEFTAEASWLGKQAEKAAMQPGYRRAGTAITASGRLKKVSGLNAAPLGSGRQTGYFAAVSFPLPEAGAAAVNTAAGTIMTLSGNNWSESFDKNGLAPYLKTTGDGGTYLEFLLYIAEDKADTPVSYQMVLDFDGSENNGNQPDTYRATSYTLEFGGVTLLEENVPVVAQEISLKTEAGYGAAHTAAGVSLSGNTYTLDAAALESAAVNLSLLRDQSGNLNALFEFRKPAGIVETPASVELSVNGGGETFTPSLSTEKFDGGFPLCGANDAYLPNEAYAVEVAWKDGGGNLIGISKLLLTRQTVFTVAFDLGNVAADGLSPKTDPVKVISGNTVTLPDETVRIVSGAKDKEVSGWYLDGNYTQPFDASRPVTANRTLHAKWEIPQELRELLTQFEGSSTIDARERSVTPTGAITIPGETFTIPEGTEFKVTKAITGLTVSQETCLTQINGTFYVDKKGFEENFSGKIRMMLIMGQIQKLQMAYGVYGDMILTTGSNQNPRQFAGESYGEEPGPNLKKASLRGAGLRAAGEDPYEGEAQITVFQDGRIQLESTLTGIKICFLTGDFTINDSFYYVHKDNILEIGESAVVTLLKDAVLQGKMYLKGSLVSNGFHVTPSGDGKNTHLGRVCVEKAGLDLSAFQLGPHAAVDSDGKSVSPMALKWNLDGNAWDNVVTEIVIVPYGNAEEGGKHVHRYSYSVSTDEYNMGVEDPIEFNLYQGMEDLSPMTLPEGITIREVSAGSYNLELTFDSQYKDQTFYLEVEQYGVRSQRLPITVSRDPMVPSD